MILWEMPHKSYMYMYVDTNFIIIATVVTLISLHLHIYIYIGRAEGYYNCFVCQCVSIPENLGELYSLFKFSSRGSQQRRLASLECKIITCLWSLT